MYCVTISSWLIVVKEGINALFFHIFEYSAEVGAKCRVLNLVLNSISLYASFASKIGVMQM